MRKRKIWFLLFPILIFTLSGFIYDKWNNTDDEFSIVVLPDTQYYTSEKNGGKKEMFEAQTNWIVQNAAKEKVAYVIQLGDVSDDGEKVPQEWVNASKAMYVLDKPQPDYPHGIPYGMAVGNHDQTKSQYPLSGTTKEFNKYFGIDHFKSKPWYGGHYRDNNDSHYDLLEAGGIKFIIIYFEYDSYDEDIENMNRWGASLLEKYKDRKAILVSHSIIHFNKTKGTNEKGFPPFSKQAQRRFDRLKSYPNVTVTLSGHVGDNGEGYRVDGYAGNLIHSFLSDYQSRTEGGHGLMRLMTFSKSKDLIRVRTFSPYTGEEETDDDSHFTVPWMYGNLTARYLDFTNDGITEPATFLNGKWNIEGDTAMTFGKEDDIPACADYNGDGASDIAIFRPSEGKFIFPSGKEISLGQEGDIPVCGDYDGDGFADVAVYRPATLTWYINGMDSIKFGNKKGVPIPGDYDGDGKMDVGIFRLDNSLWQTPLGNIPLQVQHTPGDIPVPADYNGDGKTEMAVFRPATNEWIIDKMQRPIIFGQKDDIPMPGNYHKGGKTEIAVFRNGKIILKDGTVVQTKDVNAADFVNISSVVKKMML